MKKNYRSIDFNIITDFVEGEIHDIYALVKQLYFKDMYMSIYEYYFNKLSKDDPLEKFIDITYGTYRKQNKLNTCLKVTSGKYYDDYLMKCVVHELYEEFSESPALKTVPREEFRRMVFEHDKNHIDHELMSEYNVNVLTSLLSDKFSNKKELKIDEVVDFIKEISENDTTEEEPIEYFTYFNKLIEKKNITLNGLGQDSKIGKKIYDLSIDKMPTKNQIIMIILTLKLNKEEQKTILGLLKDKVKNTSNSNKYSFEEDSERDKIILHWLDNIFELEKIATKTNKTIVAVMNDILKQAEIEILS